MSLTRQALQLTHEWRQLVCMGIVQLDQLHLQATHAQAVANQSRRIFAEIEVRVGYDVGRKLVRSDENARRSRATRSPGVSRSWAASHRSASRGSRNGDRRRKRQAG